MVVIFVVYTHSDDHIPPSYDETVWFKHLSCDLGLFNNIHLLASGKCVSSVFPIFLENELLKVDKILGLTFFQARKDFEGLKMAFFHSL